MCPVKIPMPHCNFIMTMFIIWKKKGKKKEVLSPVLWTNFNFRKHSSSFSLSLTVREELRLRVFQNRILRRIFGPKSDEKGEWRMLHNEEINSLYRSSNIVRLIKSRRLRCAGHLARMEEGMSVFKILTSSLHLQERDL